MTAKTMTLTLLARSSCVCGAWDFTTARFRAFAVNKASLRQLPGPGLMVRELVPRGASSVPVQKGEDGCPVCGFTPPAGYETYPLPAGSVMAGPWRLSPASLAEVETYRAERWPELAGAES